MQQVTNLQTFESCDNSSQSYRSTNVELERAEIHRKWITYKLNNTCDTFIPSFQNHIRRPGLRPECSMYEANSPLTVTHPQNFHVWI